MAGALKDWWNARLPRPGEGFDQPSYALLVSSLFSSPASIIPGGVAGILTPFLCWISTGLVVFEALTVLVTLIVLLRLATFISYRRSDHSRDGYNETRRWDRDYFLGATAFSAVLGYSCYAALAHTDDAAAHITSVASTIAIASGYVSRNAGRPKFVAVQLLTFCVPMAFGLIQAHNPYYQYIGYFAFLYVAANIAITNSLHRNLLALSDATKQSKALASALHSQNLTLDAALNTMIHGLAMFDRDLKLAVSNAPHRTLFGLPETLALPGTPITAIARFLVERQVVAAEQLRDLREALAEIQLTQQTTSREIQTRAGRGPGRYHRAGGRRRRPHVDGGRDRAESDRGAHRADGALRRVDRLGEPIRIQHQHRRGFRPARPHRRSLRPALCRSRRLQAGQRQPGPRYRRSRVWWKRQRGCAAPSAAATFWRGSAATSSC